MKNRTHIETILLDHLRDTPENGKTILLSGTWGCGKTHLWREKIVPQFASEKPVTVSLFGIDSVANLKTTLMNECLVRKVDSVTEGEWKKARTGLGKLITFGLRKGIDKLLDMEILSGHIDPMQLIDEGLLICLDDVERVSRQVPLEEVLGVATMLAEVKKARVVLIMNESQLTERKDDAAAVMQRFRERVFSAYIAMDADLETMFDEFCKKFPANEEIYQLLKQYRNLILSIFERVQNCNLRTLGRLIQGIAYLSKSVLAKFVLEKHIYFLTVMHIESERGTLRDKRFYQFGEFSMLFDLNEKNMDAEAKEKLSIYREYFGDHKVGLFSYSDALYDYVSNGYLDTEQVTLEFSPPNDSSSPLQGLLAEVSDGGFFYYSDQQYIQFMESACGLISADDEINTSQLISLLVYLDSAASRSSSPLPHDIHDKLNRRLADNVSRGDESFGSIERMHFGKARDLWMDLITPYDKELRKTQDRNLFLKIEKIVNQCDALSFVREICSRPNALMTALEQSLLDKISETWKINRRFHLTALSNIRDELHSYSEEIYPALPTDRKRFASALDKLLLDSSLDNSDRFRIDQIFRTCQSWL